MDPPRRLDPSAALRGRHPHRGMGRRRPHGDGRRVPDVSGDRRTIRDYGAARCRRIVRSSCASTATPWATATDRSPTTGTRSPSTPGLQGGFIWEWKDHGLRQRRPDGTDRLAYGGQFGDEPNDGNFVADGLVSADLEPHPAMREVAWVYRPVVVSKRPRRPAHREPPIVPRSLRSPRHVGAPRRRRGRRVRDPRPARRRSPRGGQGAAPARGFAARTPAGTAHGELDDHRGLLVRPRGSPRRVGPGGDRPRCGEVAVTGRTTRARRARRGATSESVAGAHRQRRLQADAGACRATRCRRTSAPALAGGRRRPPAGRRARRP